MVFFETPTQTFHIRKPSVNLLISWTLHSFKIHHVLQLLPFVFQYVEIIEFSTNMCLSNPFHYVVSSKSKRNSCWIPLSFTITPKRRCQRVWERNVFEGCVWKCSEDNFGHNIQNISFAYAFIHSNSSILSKRKNNGL